VTFELAYIASLAAALLLGGAGGWWLNEWMRRRLERDLLPHGRRQARRHQARDLARSLLSETDDVSRVP
jgi:membrane protein YqaA with SNARE-associated domain